MLLYKARDRMEAAPGLSVSNRVDGARWYDLTDYLGEHGGVRTSKSISEPAGGFVITFSDQMHRERMDSIYGLVEPMDRVEIYMTGNAITPSLVMRGFVSDISRNTGVDGEGRPTRTVTISGQDYGKILQILQIIYLNNSVIGDNILSGFKLLEKYSINVSNNPPVAVFMSIVLDSIVNPFLADITNGGKIVSNISIEGRVSSSSVNTWDGGNIWGLLNLVSDVQTGFNEMFIRDLDDVVELVLRPRPWRMPDGSFLRGNAPFDTVKIPLSDVMSQHVTRSDSGVANLFWMRAPHLHLLSNNSLRLQAQVAPVYDYENIDPKLYGIRQMDVTTMLIPPDGDIAPGAKEDSQSTFTSHVVDWQKDRLSLLQSASQDAVIFERGTLSLRGNENIQIGMDLQIDDLSIQYVTAVDHDYQPFRSFTTSVSFERGDGYIRRLQSDASPYLQELVR